MSAQDEQEAFEKQFQEAVHKLRNMVRSRKGLIDEISRGFHFDKRHLLALIDGEPASRINRRLKSFIVDYALDNLARNTFYTMSSVLECSTDVKNYRELEGEYVYYRYAPTADIFRLTSGKIAIRIVDDVPYFFQQSQNHSQEALSETKIGGKNFLYDFKGTIVRNGRNIFCFSSRAGAIRSIIFQLPRAALGGELSVREALACRRCNGAVLSCLPSGNPFAAKAQIYHESFIGPRTGGRAIDPEMMYSSYFTGFLFGNTDDIPQAFRPSRPQPD